MIQKTPTIGSDQLAQLLSQFIQNGGFSISVLTDKYGLPIASAFDNGFDPDRQAAVVGLIQKNVAAVAHGLGVSQADEISFHYDQGQRLICKFFKANDHELILAITVLDKGKSYRRLMKKVISEISQLWSQYWE